MKLQQALMTALDFERKVRDHYLKGAQAIVDPQGKKVFETLGAEEVGHVAYLEHCLEEWTKSGKLAKKALKSALPKGAKWVEAAKKKLAKKPGRREASADELEAVRIALQYERDAAAFYQELVKKLPEQEQFMFRPFLDIEEGHVALVQAQLDSLQGMGWWFDTMEFQLEAG